MEISRYEKFYFKTCPNVLCHLLFQIVILGDNTQLDIDW